MTLFKALAEGVCCVAWLQGNTYLGWFEGVVWCEGYVEEKHSSLVHGAWRAQDGRPPLIDVVSFGTGTAFMKKRADGRKDIGIKSTGRHLQRKSCSNHGTQSLCSSKGVHK